MAITIPVTRALEYQVQNNQTNQMNCAQFYMQSKQPRQTTTDLKTWQDQGWLHCKHADLFKVITAWMRYRSNTTKITRVKGYSSVKGNKKTDKLAREGAQKESIERIPTGCNTPDREQIWSLARELWNKKSQNPILENYGALLGCCLKKDNGKSVKSLNRLFRILISESMYMIGKTSSPSRT